MKFELVLRKIVKVWYFVGLGIVGIIFTVAGIFAATKPKTEKIEVTATITKIESEYDTLNETTDYDVYLTYKDEAGNVYENIIIHDYQANWKEGTEITVYYDPANPTSVSTSGQEIIIYIFIALGVICLLVGIIKVAQAIKTPLDETNELDKVNMNKVTEAMIEEVKENDEEVKEYYFHFTKSLNQSYIFETPNRKPIYEAISQNLGILSKHRYNFVNHLNGKQEVKACSHTVTHSYGTDTLQVATDSYFKINDVNCWDALGKLGYSLEPIMKGLHVDFRVKRYGIEVAELNAAGANVAKGTNYKMGNIATTGVYSVKCKESDIEGVFLACFIVSKTYTHF